MSSKLIEAFAERIPADLLERSGKVFYSGRAAFAERADLYVLGINPGGDPETHKSETVARHTAAVLSSYADDWSAYRDESWNGAPAGTYGMAPRVPHLFAGLGLNPGRVPCSNLVFVRTRREIDLAAEVSSALGLCWLSTSWSSSVSGQESFSVSERPLAVTSEESSKRIPYAANSSKQTIGTGEVRCIWEVPEEELWWPRIQASRIGLLEALTRQALYAKRWHSPGRIGARGRSETTKRS